MKGRRNERGKECGSATRPARIIQEEDFIMKKASKRAISLLLTLTLMFSAVMMFPSSVSATLYEIGTKSTDTGSISGKVFSASVSRPSGSATATSTFPVIAGLTAHVRLYYTIPYATTDWQKTENQKSDSSKTVTATASASGALSKAAYGGHDLSYGDSHIHLETKA